MLNWDDIRVFLAVVKSGQLKDAARQLQMDPITVGRRITRLEQALGTPLFARSSKGYRLLPDAEAILTEAAPMSTAFDETLAAAQNRQTGTTGTLRVGAPDGCATYILPRLLPDLVKKHPGLRIEIVSSGRSLDLLRREVDIAISLAPSDLKAVSSQPLADYELWMAETENSLDAAVGYIPELSFDNGLGLQNNAPDLGRYLANTANVQLQLILNGLGRGYIHDFLFPLYPELKAMADPAPIKRMYHLIRPISATGTDRLDMAISDLSTAFQETIFGLQKSFIAARKTQAIAK